jgi:hypothetical protein
MEVLGGGTTIISLLQTAWQVIEYVKAVKSAGEAQQKVLIELIRARNLLNSLSDVAETFKNDEWSRALQSLNGPDGVLSEFKALLEWIMDEMGVPKSQQQKASPLTPTPGTSGLRERIRLKFSSRTRPAREKQPNGPDNSHNQTTSMRLKFAIKDILWPFKEAQVQELLGKLERIKTHLLLALSSDNVRLSGLIRDQLQSVHGEIGILREHQEGSKAWTPQQDLIFRSIAGVDFSSNHFSDDIVELKESASTLLQDPIFAGWLANDTRDTSLLLTGMGGTGKTSMCRVVENYLRSSSDTFVVAVYFSSFKNQGKAQSLQTVLAFIIETMLHQRPQVQKYYNRLMLTGEGPLMVEDSLRIIHRARQDFRNFYILIDGLDSCDDQQAQVIIERLTRLHHPLRIFATSRYYRLTTQFSNELKMEDLTLSGIRSYISRSLLAKYPVAPFGYSLGDFAELERLTEEILRRSDGQYV